MKVAVAGKGGVGKTFVSGTLARLLARDGLRVTAIDADPAMNLGRALGIPADSLKSLIPISENRNLIRERTGVEPGRSWGAVFKLTPYVGDLAEKYGVEGPDGVRLLVMGTVRTAGGGCMCPANAFLSALLRHILLRSGEAVVMDMEPGLEHLGRGVVRGFDALLIVVEPGTQSLETAQRIRQLAEGLSVRRVAVVGNKVRSSREDEFLASALKKLGMPPPLLSIPYDERVAEADLLGMAPMDLKPPPESIEYVRRLKEALKGRLPIP